MEDLQKQFASQLTASVIKDVFTEAQSDVGQAYNRLRCLISQEPSEDDIQRYLRELDSFEILGKDVILKTLTENRWDIDKTIVVLFPLLEDKQKEEKKRKIQLEREQIRIKEREKASAFMERTFQNIPKAKIDKLLEENDGDVNATVEMIINMQDERERKAREEERLRVDRMEKCNAVAIRFNKSPNEVEQLLNAQNWDIATVVNQLVKAEQDVKYQRMIQLYHYRRPDEIRHALLTNNYDEISTIKFIDEKIERETIEAEKKAKELKERKEAEKKRRDELQKKQIEEIKRMQLINQQKAKEAESKVLEERKLLEQQQQEAEYSRIENEKKECEAQLAREREEEARIFAARQEAILHLSVVVADQIHQEVAELGRQNILNLAIENKIRDVPTFNPPTPVEAPHNLGRDSLQEELKLYQCNNNKDRVVDASNSHSPNQPDIDVVRMEAQPTRVDYGETITLTWEFTHEQANASNWIGLYREGTQCKEYETYEWAVTKKGCITFKAPSYTGRFFFRFLYNKTYTCWGSSNFVEVGPKFKMTPTLTQNEVTLKVEQSSGQVCPYAWVAMYEPNRDNQKYYTYTYLPGTPPTEVSFKIPKVGVWEFRLFPQLRSYFVADTCEVEFKGNDSLSMEVDAVNNLVVVTHSVVSVDPYYDNVWIGIYHTFETDVRQYRRYKKVPSDSGKLMVKAIQTPGTYEARLFAGGSNKIIAKSNTVVVLPKVSK